MIEAAGGVVWRRDAQRRFQVLVVHRPRYDDWSLPKGKLEPGESHPEAALREVEEETGLRCRLGEELPEVRYRDREDRAKRVRYWMMTPESGAFTPNSEVDEAQWVSVDEASEMLSYPHDVELLIRMGEPVRTDR